MTDEPATPGAAASAAVTLRPARATEDDGRAFARYLDTAAEGFFRFWLGTRAPDIVAAAFRQPGHDLSNEHVTFAEREGATVGMVSGYTAAAHRRSTLVPLRRAAGGLAVRMRLVSIACAPVLRIIDSIADDDFYVQAVAVDEECRGQGLGGLLIDHIESRAADAGSARLVLDVGAKNRRAQRLYERRGMAVASRWPRWGPALFVRMTRSLSRP